MAKKPFTVNPKYVLDKYKVTDQYIIVNTGSYGYQVPFHLQKSDFIHPLVIPPPPPPSKYAYNSYDHKSGFWFNGVEYNSDASGSVITDYNSLIVQYNNVDDFSVNWVAQIKSTSHTNVYKISQDHDDEGVLVIVGVVNSGSNTPISFYDSDGVQRASTLYTTHNRAYYSTTNFHRELFLAKYDVDGFIQWTKRLLNANSTVTNPPFPDLTLANSWVWVEHASFFRGQFRVAISWGSYSSDSNAKQDWALLIDDPVYTTASFPAIASAQPKGDYAEAIIVLDAETGSGSYIDVGQRGDETYGFQSIPAVRTLVYPHIIAYSSMTSDEGNFVGSTKVNVYTGQFLYPSNYRTNLKAAESYSSFGGENITLGEDVKQFSEYRAEIGYRPTNTNYYYTDGHSGVNMVLPGTMMKLKNDQMLYSWNPAVDTQPHNQYYRRQQTISSYTNENGNAYAELTQPGFPSPNRIISKWYSGPSNDINTNGAMVWRKAIYTSHNSTNVGYPVFLIPNEDSDYFWAIGIQHTGQWTASFTMRLGNGEGNQQDRVCPAGAGIFGAKFKISDGTYLGHKFFIDNSGSFQSIPMIKSWIDPDTENVSVLFSVTSSTGIIVDPDVSPQTYTMNAENKQEILKATFDTSGSYLDLTMIHGITSSYSTYLNSHYFAFLYHDTYSHDGPSKPTPTIAVPSTPDFYVNFNSSNISGNDLTPDVAPSGTGSMNNITIVGGGPFGEYATFNGSNSRILFDNIMDMSNDTDFTLSAWIRKADVTGVIFSKGGKVENRYWYLQHNTSNYFELIMQSGSGPTYTSINRTRVPLYEFQNLDDTVNWHHIAVVARRAENFVRIYYDGKLVEERHETTGNSAQYYASLDTTNTQPLIVGSLFLAGGHTNHYSGAMDQLAIWQSALTSDQIWSLYKWQAEMSGTLV